MLISQDKLKAIEFEKIGFFVVNDSQNMRGNYNLLAKTPKFDGGFYEYLILFEHENIEVLKDVMRFFPAFQLAMPDNFILHVDLPTLYNCAMKI